MSDTVIWTSSNPNIASVDRKTGKVKAVKEGKVTITGKTLYGSKTAKAIITVIK